MQQKYTVFIYFRYTRLFTSERDKKRTANKDRKKTEFPVAPVTDRLCTPKAGGLGSILSPGADPHMAQLRPGRAK